MALDKLTFLEVHLDGAQIGPKSIRSGSDADDEAVETETEEMAEAGESGSGGPRKLLALFAGAVALAAIVAWRRRKSGQTTMDDYTESEDEGGLAEPVELDDVDA